jgi:predicted nuclease of predicted toxin-antitoxin system
MAKFLIDVNLPYHFKLWHDKDYIHQHDIGDEWPDEKIWNFAQKEGLTIVSKDSDFSNKILLHTPPPKVIHIKFGNLKMKDFYSHINSVWKDVLELNTTHKLVNVFKDRIEGIN